MKKMVVSKKIISGPTYRISPYIETPKAYRTYNLRQINLLSLLPFKLRASIFIDKDIHNDVSYRRITPIHLFHVVLVRNQELLPNWYIHYFVGIFTFKNHEMCCMVKYMLHLLLYKFSSFAPSARAYLRVYIPWMRIKDAIRSWNLKVFLQ